MNRNRGNIRFFTASILFKSAVIIIFSLFIASTALAQFTAFEQAIADFDAEVARGVAQDSVGCVSVAVFIGNKVVWAKGYGWADIEDQIPATAETIGRIGSISKPFTAVAMVQLVERGIIELDDPVEQYFPEINGLADTLGVTRPVTFRQLASHTAGLIREPRLRGAASGSIYFWEDKILESIPTTYFFTHPETRYSYSNIGFGMLGLATSRAAKVPFMELVTENIFKPLGMTSSTYILNTPEMWARMSVPYSKNRRTGEVSRNTGAIHEHFGRGYKVPNGGIYSTVGDLAKFAAAMMGESSVQILSPESREKMLTPQPPAGGYGLGFTLSERDGLKTAGHGGSVAGYQAGLTFDLNTKIGVAMLRTSGYRPNTGALLRRLIEAKSK